MAGVSLLVLSKRLKTVSSTRKITSAIGLVAASKFQKAKRLLAANEVHFQSLKGIVADVVNHVAEPSPVYFANHSESPKMYVVFNSAKGMVGGYNSEIMGKTLQLLEAAEKPPFLMTTGTRGLVMIDQFIHDDNFKMITVGDIPQFKNTEEIYGHLIGLYQDRVVSEINLIYTEYLSPVKNQVVMKRFLPLDEEFAVTDPDRTEYEFQPQPDRMQDRIFPLYLKEKLYNCALHAKTSEQAVRMRSMDSATKNADGLLNDLSKQFNRLRQNTITQQITEIVGGAEALK